MATVNKSLPVYTFFTAISSETNANDFPYVMDTLKVLRGKWKLSIINFLYDGEKRFGELRRIMPGITQAMLTSHLRELEADGLVTRKVYYQVPLKVEYSLTDAGRSIIPIMKMMNQWGNDYKPGLQNEKSLSLL